MIKQYLHIETERTQIDLHGDVKWLLSAKRAIKKLEPEAFISIGGGFSDEQIKIADITKLEYWYYQE